MSEPLAVLRFKHALLELWPDCCLTVFPDGLDVPATPNGLETLLDTVAHEASHHLLAQVLHDRPSVCLRAQAEGEGRRWTDERHDEETKAFAMGLLLADLLKAVVRAYGRQPGEVRHAGH